MGRDNENREKQLLRCIPTILNYKTLLYIGAKKRMIQMLQLFVDTSYAIDIIEIWSANVTKLKDLNGIRRIIQGDVRNITQMELPCYDVVMWWHGPEHVYEKELYDVLRNLETLATKLVVVASPWGESKQGGKRGNLSERHVTSLYSMTFKDLGWNTDMIGNIGNKDRTVSNLLAWSIQ